MKKSVQLFTVKHLLLTSARKQGGGNVTFTDSQKRRKQTLQNVFVLPHRRFHNLITNYHRIHKYVVRKKKWSDTTSALKF